MNMDRLPSANGTRGRSNSGPRMYIILSYFYNYSNSFVPADVEAITVASDDKNSEPKHNSFKDYQNIPRAVDDSFEASALERRHQQLNQLFGIKVWKSSIR